LVVAKVQGEEPVGLLAKGEPLEAVERHRAPQHQARQHLTPADDDGGGGGDGGKHAFR